MTPEPLEAALTAADDRVLLNHWLPPRAGIVPRIRIGKHWVSILWILPAGGAVLITMIAIAQSLRELPSVQALLLRHPGIAQGAPSIDSGFPWWLQIQHFVNMFFMLFIIRAGIQILADQPRLYWGRDCTPGTDWFRFQLPVPKGRCRCPQIMSETLRIMSVVGFYVRRPNLLVIPALCGVRERAVAAFSPESQTDTRALQSCQKLGTLALGLLG